MSVLVIVYHAGEVLVATSGKWYIDTLGSPAMQKLVAKYQRSKAPTEAEAIKEIVKQRCRNTLLRIPLEKKTGSAPGETYYTGRFVCTDQDLSTGFIKGGIEGAELPPQAIAREFKEETGYTFPDVRFQEKGVVKEPGKTTPITVFRLDVDATEKDAIVAAWTKQFNDGIGELIKLEWKPVSDVRSMEQSLNPQSKAAFTYLPTSGGVFSARLNKMATTRSMTRRKTRRSKSHCVGIKRSAVCKRTQGCKQASGPKRRFCRTAKNRKH